MAAQVSLDQMIGNTGVYLFGETNWYHWMRDADGFPAAVGRVGGYLKRIARFQHAGRLTRASCSSRPRPSTAITRRPPPRMRVKLPTMLITLRN